MHIVKLRSTVLRNIHISENQSERLKVRSRFSVNAREPT